MLREATKFTDGEPKEYVRVTGSRAAGQTSENRSAVQALKRPGKSRKKPDAGADPIAMNK